MKYIPRDEKKNELEKLTTAAMIGLGGGAAPPAGAGVVPPAGAVVGVVSPGGGGVVGSSPLALSPPSAVSASSSAKQVRSGICQDTISSLFFPFFCCFILSPHRFSSLSLSLVVSSHLNHKWWSYYLQAALIQCPLLLHPAFLVHPKWRDLTQTYQVLVLV